MGSLWPRGSSAPTHPRVPPAPRGTDGPVGSIFAQERTEERKEQKQTGAKFRRRSFARRQQQQAMEERSAEPARGLALRAPVSRVWAPIPTPGVPHGMDPSPHPPPPILLIPLLLLCSCLLRGKRGKQDVLLWIHSISSSYFFW